MTGFSKLKWGAAATAAVKSYLAIAAAFHGLMWHAFGHLVFTVFVLCYLLPLAIDCGYRDGWDARREGPEGRDVYR